MNFIFVLMELKFLFSGLCELLLSRGGQMEWADRDGLTSLSWACLKGQLTTATLLIKQGCDIEHADKSGRTCLDLAAYKGNPDVVSPIFWLFLAFFVPF